MSFDLTGKRIFVAGHRGMLGSALLRRLEREDCECLTAERSDLDLREQPAVRAWFAANTPDAVILAAAKVGGIKANDNFPADFLQDNLLIQSNVIGAAHEHHASKLLFLGSSCIYPKFAEQPIGEDQLLTGPLEPTNEWYAIAKIAGIKLCQAYRKQHGCDFISAMPTNLYGPGDNYDPETSHVLPALIRKAADAKQSGEQNLRIWGSGTPLREFLHVDDLADALVFLLKNYSAGRHINVGSGQEISIADLARLVMQVAGLTGEVLTDRSQPDGTPRKLLDSSRISAMGWNATIPLEEGVKTVFDSFMKDRT